MLKPSKPMLLSLGALTAMVLMMPTSALALCAAPRDLNGVWRANDGGTYYIRQISNDIWWVGMSRDDGRTWTNVYRGVRSGNAITGQWADVPRGRINSGGILNLSVQTGSSGGILGFTRSAVTGGFGGSRWFQPCDDTRLIPSP